MSEKFSLKDHLFNPEKVNYLAGLIKAVYPKFNDKAFKIKVLKRFPELELKERISWIRENLKAELPSNYQEALKILLDALPKPLNPENKDDDFGDFIFAPLSEFVAIYGCEEKYLEISLNALEEMTQRFSVEYAIRYFINAFPEQTIAKIIQWAGHSNYHVRRLASEGTRPRLPWAQNIKVDQKMIVEEILSQLYYDHTRFVVRSVANHLNDISKIDAEFVVKTLENWKKSKRQNESEMEYLISHALRTLVKKGNEAALNLLGYHKDPKIIVEQFNIKTPKVTIGESLEFTFELKAEQDENLIIDYLIHFKTKNGELSPKVFKIKKAKLKKTNSQTFNKKHPLRKMTTKKLYPGTHKLELQINGEVYAKAVFDLLEK